MVSYTHLFLAVLLCWPNPKVSEARTAMSELFSYFCHAVCGDDVSHYCHLPPGANCWESCPRSQMSLSTPHPDLRLHHPGWFYFSLCKDLPILPRLAFPSAILPSLPRVLGSIGMPCWDSFSMDGCELPVDARNQARCSARAGCALNHCALTQPLPTHFYLHACMTLNWTLADPNTLEHLIFV